MHGTLKAALFWCLLVAGLAVIGTVILDTLDATIGSRFWANTMSALIGGGWILLLYRFLYGRS